MKSKITKDYYKEIDKAISQHEFYKWTEHSIDWICDRISWCWKFRKITEEQMNELADRICRVMERKF